MTEDDRRWQQIIERIAPDAKLISAEAMAGGVSADMTLLTLSQPDGRTKRVVVRRPSHDALRRDPNSASKQFATLRTTRATGLPTPIPLALQTSSDLLGSPYLVLDYIPGQSDRDPTNLTAFCTQLAEQLVAIHRADTANVDLSHLPLHPNACPERERETSPAEPAAEADIRSRL